jgi:hypothetical protein
MISNGVKLGRRFTSLSHLARGIQIVTGCEMWEGTAMAIGLDLLIVALECAMVATVGTKAYKPVARFANPALLVAFVWSAGLNAFAFASVRGTCKTCFS